jgi:hypothetical protein
LFGLQLAECVATYSCTAEAGKLAKEHEKESKRLAKEQEKESKLLAKGEDKKLKEDDKKQKEDERLCGGVCCLLCASGR